MEYQKYLPYINAAEGLGRVGNNLKLYTRLLKLFLADGHLPLVDAAARAANYPDAAAQAHAIKGAAANLSLSRAYEDALALEQCFKAGGGGYEPLFLALHNSMAETFDNIYRFVQEAETV